MNSTNFSSATPSLALGYKDYRHIIVKSLYGLRNTAVVSNLTINQITRGNVI